MWRLPATSMLLNSVVHSQLLFNLAEFDIVDHSLFLIIISFFGFQTPILLTFFTYYWLLLFIFLNQFILISMICTHHSILGLSSCTCSCLYTCPLCDIIQPHDFKYYLSVDGCQGVSLSWTSLWMSLLCPHACILINISIWISTMYLKFNLSKTVLPIACSCEIHSTCQAYYLCTGSGQKPGSHPLFINFFHIPHSAHWQVLPSKYTWSLITAHHTIAPILVQVHHSSQGLLKYPSS